MKPVREAFRIDLGAAKLCMELDCNTIFDASMFRHCPTCGSAEYFPLDAWLNRERGQKPARFGLGADASAPALKPLRRALWLDRLRRARSEKELKIAAGSLRLRPPRRRAV